MNINNYFPLGIAKGKAFFNRTTERKFLTNNISAGNNCFIVSPRRYGKTSLILKVLNELEITYKEIDLFTAKESEEIDIVITNEIFELIKSITPKHEQLIKYIKDYFKKLQVKTIITHEGLSLEVEKGSAPGINVLEMLSALDKILLKKEMNAVIFFDEFQQVGKLENSNEIEGAIRHIAQKSDNITFLFSGSNRHILNNMIDDKSKPLYKLCNRYNLERMQKCHYFKHITEASKDLWGESLAENTILKILELTELHPYYVNALCNNIYINSTEKLPSPEDVVNIWNDYVLQEKTNIARELEALNHSQYSILKHIIKGNNTILTGKESLSKLQLSVNAVLTGIRKLTEKDIIYKTNNGEYAILDPLIRESVNNFIN
jgi:uncharacterized protein